MDTAKAFFKEWFNNKDKSLLIGQLSGTILIFLIFISVFWWEANRLLGSALVLAGISMGWITGILLSPYHEYNNEAAKFSRATQAISTFISGAIVAKVLSIMTMSDIKQFFGDLELVARTSYFLASFALTAILVYYDRVYPNLDEQGSFLTWCREIYPGKTLSIHNDSSPFKLTVINRGAVELHLQGGEKYDPQLPHIIVAPNTSQTYYSSEKGLDGAMLYIHNPSQQSGKYTLRLHA